AAAPLLAHAGHRVLVLERERFPRYHIGESLLSATLPILDAVRATPAIERHGFLKKPGGTFLWGRQREPWSFWFREDPGGRPHAFQVVRAEFDQLLLENARAHGADVREEHAVTEVETDGEQPVVHARAASGETVRLTPRFVVDASGQAAVLGRARSLRRLNDFFKNLAIFGYFRGAERLPGELANHILSAAFPDGWFWYIPLPYVTLSVGAVPGASPEAEALAEYEATYRGAFERYLRFLYFFYDHNEEPDSYFWTARRILTHAPHDLSTREAFVRLISGGGDWDGVAPLLAREHARWADGIRYGRAGAVPGAALLRARATTALT